MDKLAPLEGNCLVSALALVFPMLGALRGFLGALTGIPVAVMVTDMVYPFMVTEKGTITMSRCPDSVKRVISLIALQRLRNFTPIGVLYALGVLYSLI